MPKTRLASPSHPVWRRGCWGGDCHDDDLGFGGIGSDLPPAAESGDDGCGGDGSAALGAAGDGEATEREERDHLPPILPEWSLARPTDINYNVNYNVNVESPPPPPSSVARSATWEHSYDLLVEYVQCNGNALVPNNYTKHPRLGHWVKNQRTFFRQNKMTEERIRRLEGVGFCFDARNVRRPQMPHTNPDAIIDTNANANATANNINADTNAIADVNTSNINADTYATANNVNADTNANANAITNGNAPPEEVTLLPTDSALAPNEELALNPRFDTERVVKRVSTAGRKHYYCRVKGCMKEPQGACEFMCRRHFNILHAEKTSDRSGVAAHPWKNRCKVKGCVELNQGMSEGMCRSHFLGETGTWTDPTHPPKDDGRIE